MRRVAWVLGALVPLLLLAVPPATAEHEADHRFQVHGRVLHPDGSGVCNAPVVAYVAEYPAGTDKNRSTRADGGGAYSIQLHVHSDEVGLPVTVYVPGAGVSAMTSMDFDPLDTETLRRKQVDLVVAADFTPECPNLLLDIGLWVGIPLLIGGVAFVALRAMPRRAKGAPLRNLPGLGSATEAELRGLGIRTVEELAEADPKHLADESELSYRQAKKLVRKAQELT